MKKKTRAIAKRRKRAMVVRRKRSLTSDIPKQDTLALAAVKKLGVKIVSHKDYFRPVMTNEQILWVLQTDKKSGKQTEKPFVPYPPILDNLHRRGVQSIIPDSLPDRPCKCYNASAGDVTFRSRVVITLRNGQVFAAEGDACVHNSWAKSALPRHAETRAKARAGRDATNIGVPCIVELAPYDGHMRQGDRILSKEEMERVVMGEVVEEDDKKTSPTVAKGSPAMGTPTEAEMRGGKTATEKRKEIEHDDPWVKANARLHAEGHRLKLDTGLLHKYIHAKENVKSIKEVPAEKLADYADNLKGVTEGSSGHKKIVEELNKMKEAA
ncbi:hypothetical protein LCGC14_0451280 [marine sediment metagenome]|uniref:Ribosomal RNA-processing protein 14/surfeit locus protein 6 C-terminal domain-containing protein n=1 Tax=marine sediment metagenome TaxID=412755 RepID=A0A0F9T126_9ZZZZ